jgi:hypothetical protein
VVAAPEPQMTESEQKEAQRLAGLAQPPAAFEEEASKLVVINKVRECSDEGPKGDWEKLLKQELATAISPSDPEHVNRQGCLFVLCTTLCKGTDEASTKMIQSALCKPLWDATDLSRGLAWCVTGAVASRLTEESPKFLQRFSDIVSAIAAANGKLTLEIIVKDVFARTANYLDALQISWEYSPDWDLDYIKVWELFVGKVLTESKKSIPNVQSILDSLGSVRQTNFMRNIVPDFVGVMLSNKLCTTDDLRQWCEKQQNNEKVKLLVDELALLL